MVLSRCNCWSRPSSSRLPETTAAYSFLITQWLHNAGKCPLEISTRLLTSFPLVTQTWIDPTVSRGKRLAYCINPKKWRYFPMVSYLWVFLINMQPLFLALVKVSHKSGLLSYFSEIDSSHFSMSPSISSILPSAAGSQLEVKIFLLNLFKTVQQYQCITPPTTFWFYTNSQKYSKEIL